MSDTVQTPDLETRRMLAMLAGWLPLVGRADLVNGLKADCIGGDAEWTIDIGDTGIAIDTGHTYRAGGLDARRVVTGLRVLTWKTHPGNRWHPPEAEDVTELETLSPSDALLKVAELLAREALDRLPPLTGELAYPDEGV